MLDYSIARVLMQLSQRSLRATVLIESRVANHHTTSHLCVAVRSDLIDEVTDPRGDSGQVYIGL